MKNTLYILFFLSIASISCNKVTEVKNAADNTAQQKAADSVYPHSKDFVDSHGGVYLKDRQLCFACHGNNGSGGQAKIACTKCHSSFPHGPQFGLPSQHAASFASNKDACLSCHDVNKKKNPVACQGCHLAYPHSDDFKNGDHAEIAKSYDGKCLSCHKDMKKHFQEGNSCSNCHEGSLKIKWEKDGKTTSAHKPTDGRLPSSAPKK